MDESWVDRVTRKRLSHESSHRLYRIIASGPTHRDYEIAKSILSEREAKGYVGADQRGGVTPVEPKSGSDEELDSLLSNLPEVERGPLPRASYGNIPSHNEKDEWGWQEEPEAKKCKHLMTPTGVERLYGSSYRGGIQGAGTVVVIMTPEALPMVIRPGWTNLHHSLVEDAFASASGDVVYWPWRDMSVPENPVDAVKKIVALHRLWLSGRTLEVACFGGHGRTGTLLAVLAALAMGWPEREAVDRLRDGYCRKAVESPEQERWVHKAISAARLIIASQS